MDDQRTVLGNFRLYCKLLELKVDDSPEAAIRQIRDRKYVLKFQGKMAEKKRHTGRILMVGIGYNRKSKDHHCKVEVFAADRQVPDNPSV